jgi:glycosyltransferase involved in cell wall biosynthesis
VDAVEGKQQPSAGVSMKIALVSHVLPPSWSGQSVMIGRIFHGVPPSEYCLISTENYQSKKNQNVEHLPARYYVLPPEPKMIGSGERHWILTWVRALFRGLNIARIVKKEGSTTVIAASGNLIDIPAGWWGSVLAGVEFIPYLFDDYLYQWPEEKIRRITRKMEQLIYGRVKKVIVPNEFMRDEIEKRYPVKAFIVRNPCATLPAGDRRTVCPEYNLDDEIRIVYTGAVYHVNFDAFANLIAAVENISPNIKIHVFTAQPAEWLARNGIKSKQVILHSHAIHAEVVEAQNRAHFLFLPFSFASTIPEVIKTSAPGKLGEYLASGVPILAHVPANCFVGWYLKTHECGRVVDSNDPETLKRAILELIENGELRKKLSINARERARVDFDPGMATRALLQAVEAVL